MKKKLFLIITVIVLAGTVCIWLLAKIPPLSTVGSVSFKMLRIFSTSSLLLITIGLSEFLLREIFSTAPASGNSSLYVSNSFAFIKAGMGIGRCIPVLCICGMEKREGRQRGGGKMGETLLTIKNLSAWYSEEKRILSGFSFSLAEHEVAGLIGLNGAGKTTFLFPVPG